MTKYTRESLIEKARELASRQDGPITRDEFIESTGISRYFIERLFPDGGWRELADLVGIPPHPNAHGVLTNADVLAKFHSVVKKIENIPNLRQVAAYTKISSSTIFRRFGTISVLLDSYREWLMENEPDSPFVELITRKSKHEIVAVPKTSQVDSVVSSSVWNKGEGIVYGGHISFRGLRHAPVNEQGVVYLFGMVAYDLGLIVESVQAAFPDCEAKRCIDSRRNLWQRVRIEFEFKSSNFRSHGHDAEGCDLIVCWEHDWVDCPLEVIELRSVIDKLDP